MSDTRVFRVVGIHVATNARFDAKLDAQSEESAASLAELQGVKVASVRLVQKRSIGVVIAAVLGWLLLAFTSLSVWLRWYDPSRLRETSIEGIRERYGSLSSPNAVGFLFGTNLFALLALVLGLVVVSRTKRAGGKTLAIASAVILVLQIWGQFLPASGAALTSRGTSRAQGERALQDLNKIVQNLVPPAGQVPASPDGVVGSNAEHGEMAPVVQVMKDLTSGMLSDANEYQAKVLSLGIDSILMPMRLDSGKEIEDSRAKIAAGKQSLSTYLRSIEKRIQDTRNTLADLKATTGMKGGVISGFESGLARTLPLSMRVLECEAEVYEESEHLLTFMMEKQGQFTVEGNMLVFEDGADADIYNSLSGRIQGLAAKQAVLQEQAKDIARTRAEWMNSGFAGKVPETSPDLAQPRLVISTEKATLNDVPISFPVQLERLVGVIGEPQRTQKHGATYYIWDSLGLYATSQSGDSTIEELVVCLNKQREFRFLPGSLYAGTLAINGTNVRDIDTPRSLNRRLEGTKFGMPSDPSALWLMELPGLLVGMEVVENELADRVILTGPQVEPASTRSKPRF